MVRLAPIALVLAGGVAVAGGKAMRIEKPAPREVAIPAGTFQMGLTAEQAASANDQCQLAFFPKEIVRGQTAQGGFTDFCSEYLADLTHMQQREVFLDPYAIGDATGQGLPEVCINGRPPFGSCNPP